MFKKEVCLRVWEVIKKPKYLLSSVLIAFLLLYLLTLTLNWGLVRAVWTYDVGLWAKLSFMPKFFSSVWHDFTPFSMTYTVLLALLFGINVSLIIYYVKNFRSRAVLGATGSGLGMLAGLLGVGCASCGALLLTPIIGTVAVGAIATALPLAGAEFALLGIIILLWSILTLGKKMHNPYV